MKVYEFVSLRHDVSSYAAQTDADAEVNMKIVEFTQNGYNIHSFTSSVVEVRSGYISRHVDILFAKDGDYYNGAYVDGDHNG